MSKNISLLGQDYLNVPGIRLPQVNGGMVYFSDTSDATATADKILQGYTAYGANGSKLIGTATAGVGAVTVTEEQDSHGGTIKHIFGVNISDSTIDASKVLSGEIAYMADGTRIVGTKKNSEYVIDDIATGNIETNIVVNATMLKKYAFADYANLISVRADNVTDLSGGRAEYTFYGCTNLISIHMENLTSTANGHYFLGNCSSLTSIYFPNLIGTGDYDFANCTSLKTVVLPKCSGGYRSFIGCNSLEKVDYGSPIKRSRIYIQNFQNCSKLTTLIIRSADEIVSLNNINAFAGSPFASGKSGGTLYVPENFINDYENETNWSIILSYANNQILPIEESYYETHYADGTLIPTEGD